LVILSVPIYVSGLINASQNRQDDSTCYFGFYITGRKFLEQRFDFKIRGENFWSKDLISKSGEKISGAKI